MIVLDIETTGLYPAPGKDKSPDSIVAIGCLDDYGVKIFSAPYRSFSSNPIQEIEAEILMDFSSWLRNHDDATFLTYNGAEFDIPFITTKLLQSGTDYSSGIADQLLSFPHIDLMQYSRFVTGKRLSKDDACRKLANLYVPRKSEGLWNARIYKNPELLTENDHLEMLQHNATDLTATARLYNVVKNFQDFKEWVGGDINEKIGHVSD